MSATRIIADRTGRRCLSLPSNRLGLYLALRHWCAPGQRLLISPISADEILFLVLAAGLRPVIAPLSPRSGNLEVAGLDLASVDAVLTTNLYGVPDDYARLTGKLVIEDVAHAMESSFAGRPLGSLGAAGVFSLSKHAGAGSGGVLAVAGADDLRLLRAARDRLLLPGAFRAELASVAGSVARQAAIQLDLVRPALWLMRRLGMEELREGYRIPLRARDLLEAMAAENPLADPLPAFDPWVRADLRDYRVRRGPLTRWYQGRRAAAVAGERRRRLAGVSRLAALPGVAPAVLAEVEQPLFRVPFLVEEREAAIAALERHGVTTGYLYDPPYDDYAPGFTEPSPEPAAARWWARHVLPVDPLQARRAMPVLRRLVPAVFPLGAPVPDASTLTPPAC